MGVGRTNAGGGGVELPATIAAGEVIVTQDIATYTTTSTNFVNIGNAITVKKAGTYRIRYNSVYGNGSTAGWVQLTKNGSAVADTEIRVGEVGTIDIACAANDIIRRQGKLGYGSCTSTLFQVSILWGEVTEQISNLV